MTEIVACPFPSALPPTGVESAAWQALSRDEQLARHREILRVPEVQRVSKATMADVLSAARQRVAARLGSVPPF